MSAAMDDFGISDVSSALQSDYTVEQVKPGTPDRENTEKLSGSEQTQSEIIDVFEKKSSSEKISLEKLQDDCADAEQRKQMLDAIDAMLAQTDKTELSKEEADVINLMLDEAVPQEKQQATEQELQEQKADEQKVADDEASAASSAKATDTKEASVAEKAASEEEQKAEENERAADSAQEKEKSAREVSELRARVSEKQQEIAKLQKELYHKVSSVVEISIDKNNNAGKTIEELAEDLKASVSQDIKENPAKSVKMQITQFDENLLLAMLSLRR